LPGHGRSAHLGGPFGPHEYAEAVRAALDDAGVDAMHFWGTHTGAGVGLLLAATGLRGRIRSLVLEGAVLPGADMPSVTAALARAKATAQARGVDAARREWFEVSGWFEAMRREPARCRADEHWRMVSGFAGGPWLDTAPPRAVAPLEDRLRAIDVPVLLVNGERDLGDFVSLAERLATILPDARRCTIPGAGGFPLWEHPERVNAAVREFLEPLRGSRIRR
jgi:pimeloyl-ACP methyl ester carboxylesterase